MIKNYINGEELLKENLEFLNSNVYLATYFIYDAPLLKEHTKTNYAFKVEENGKKLLIMKVIPYDIQVFGDVSLVGKAIDNILVNGYEFANYLCEQDTGLAMAKIFHERYNIDYDEFLAMDFMSCNEKTHEYYNEVEVPTIEDIDRIYQGLLNFIDECKLEDVLKREKVERDISQFRVIRENGVIASIGKFVNCTESEGRISNIYTFPEYRGKGYCKKIVNNLKNEIIDSNRFATLNVDQKNPISNHIYTSVGFKRIFSQGQFRMKK